MSRVVKIHETPGTTDLTKLHGMTQEQILHEAVMKTAAGRKWREKYIWRRAMMKVREAEAAARAVRKGGKGGTWGMGPGGGPYEERGRLVDRGRGLGNNTSNMDERDRSHKCSAECDHDVPEKSFAADVKRKLSIKRVMPGGDAQDMKGRRAEALKRLRVAIKQKLRKAEAAAGGAMTPLQQIGRAHV